MLTACERPDQPLWLDALPLEVVDSGTSGPPLVFIPGSGNTAAVWGAFAARFPDYRTIAISQRGHGRSPDAGTAPAAYDPAILAADLLAVLETRAIAQPVTLIAHSFGGMTATAFAQRHPDRVAGVVYLDALYDPETPIPPPPSPWRRWFVTSPWDEADPDRRLGSAWRTYRAAMVAAPKTTDGVTAPMLAIFATQAPARVRAALEAHGATIAEWGTADHYLFLDRPAETEAAIRAFLRSGQ